MKKDCCAVPASPAESSDPASDEQLAGLAKALSHPARVQILRILARSQSCMCGDLVDQIPLAQSTVSQHLKVLKDAGLVRGEVDGARVCYWIDAEGLRRFRVLVAGI